MPLNVYKTSETIDSYSKNGSFTDPIFDAQNYKFDGDNGQSRDVPLFVKNDGVTEVQSVTVTPYDSSGSDETGWIRLAKSLPSLDLAIGGNPLSLPNLTAGQTVAIWMRLTVPASTPEELKQDLSLKVEGIALVGS